MELSKPIFLHILKETILSSWKQLDVNSKIDRIYWHCRALPEEGFQEICNLILDTYKQAPTPFDFAKESTAWMARNNFIKANKFTPLREKLAIMSKRPKPCEKCSGHGVFEGYAKHKGLNAHTFYCNCDAGPIAKELPEYRGITRTLTKEDPYWFVFDFDPNRNFKFELYQNIQIHNPIEANPVLAERYYSAEVYLQPCYYLPAGWQPDANANPWPEYFEKNPKKKFNPIDVKQIISLGAKQMEKLTKNKEKTDYE